MYDHCALSLTHLIIMKTFVELKKTTCLYIYTFLNVNIKLLLSFVYLNYSFNVLIQRSLLNLKQSIDNKWISASNYKLVTMFQKR